VTSLPLLARTIEGCMLCRLHQTRLHAVPGHGNEHAQILLVGEAPGEEEDKSGFPFVGPAGDLLNEILTSIGLDRSAIRISNTIHCRPPDNRSPLNDEVAACKGYLVEEIAAIRPKVIVALGGSALSALSGKTRVGENRGKLLLPKSDVRIGTAMLIGTYHPSAYLHDHRRSTYDAIAEDLKLAMRLAYGEITEQARNVAEATRELVYGKTLSYANIASALASLGDAHVIACDLEWTGVLDERIHWPWTPKTEVYSIALCGRVNGVLKSVGLELPLPEDANDLLQTFFNSHLSIFHNAQADLIWLKELGFTINLAGDSMLLASLIDEGQALGLDVLATSKAGLLPNWKAPVWPHRPQTDSEWNLLFQHNCGDVEATLLLMEALYHELDTLDATERTNIKRFYRELLLPVVPAFVDIAFNGLPVTAEGLKQTIDESYQTLHALAQEFGNLIGLDVKGAESCAMSNVKAPQVLRLYFGIEVDGSSEEALDAYKDQRPIQLIQGIRHERKFLGTYLEPWYELAQRDGRLRSIYRLSGVRTGRTSAELSGLVGTKRGGSVQVAPRELRIRKQIEARPGWKIVSADMSAAEMRVAAWLANERTMIRLFREGADLHMRTAMEVAKSATLKTALALLQLAEVSFENAVEALLTYSPKEIISRFPEWFELRQKAKGTNFGLIYGAGVDTYMDYCKREYNVAMSYEEASGSRTAYFNLYSDLQPWHRRAEAEWHERGYTLTPLGRYRRHVTEFTQAVNSPVQATASDLVLLAMIEIRKEFVARHLRALLGGFAHDNVIAEAPDEETELVEQILKQHLEHPPVARLGVAELPVPLLAEPKTAQHWSA
jgi:uracil-DNA glycosylase family 4